MLTEEQRLVASHIRGHARVTAVAGAGKTTTMVRYVLERLKSGMDPRLVRVVMFNKAAQEDFSYKLQLAAGTTFALPPVRTFHAMGRNLAMALAKEGYLPTFDPSPLGDAQTGLEMLRALQASAGTSAQREAIRDEQQQWLDAFAGFVDLAKSSLLAPETTFYGAYYPDQYQLFIEAFARFEQWRKAAGRVTFSDYLYDPCMVIAAKPELADFLANRVELFVVDEFQDINDIQFFLLKTLAGDRARLHVVGDSDQCIYEFRGARPEYMLEHFGASYPHINYQMSRTFRYGHCLALAAAHLISHNQRREPVLCISADNAPATKVELRAQSADGLCLAEVCLAEHTAGRPFRDMVFLCRTWAQAAPVELVLLQRGIPNRISGGSRVLERRETKVLIVLLRIMAGRFYEQPSSDCEQQLFDFLRFCELKIKHEALRGYARRILSDGMGFNALRMSAEGLTVYQEQRLSRVAGALEGIEKSRLAGDGLSTFLADLDLLKSVRENALNSEDGENRAATISAFVSFVAMQQDQAPAAIIDMVEGLGFGGAEFNTKTSQPTTDAVTITTMHRSKGLEWPVVILPNLSAHYMPYQAGKRRRPDAEQQESERRLMYVAMTRAIDALYLFAPNLDCVNGFNGGVRPELNILPSPFLEEMNLSQSIKLGRSLAENAINADMSVSKIATRYLAALDIGSDFAKDIPLHEKYDLGAMLVHTVHGRGRIVGVDEHGVVVQFSGKHVYFPSLVLDGALGLVESSSEDVLPTLEGQSGFATGDILAHSKFGRGVVTDIDSRFIHVRFRDGSKTFRRDLFRATRIAANK
ncbi:ATP-dependent helicase [Zhongshania aliphaticivorans]|uniref:ATP-dependent helicase n=1 Tax=Zhongshania aliphaticivorans TaxID=1470434 RepID=UPI0012E6D1B2|nr:ATP-dependent helicase [Zhongshania aliphaticivorans]CAA0100281.1 ATP-dependent DNA helicase PcrA [Zhongshania aliphaticivorans]